ncbi:ArsR/SmtB family transcription factor [Spirochaeta dissipatitropha]
MQESNEMEPGTVQAQLFKSLADPLRIRMLNLMAASSEALCICELVDSLQVPQYQISRHMAILKKTGLVASRKDGVWVYHHLATRPIFSDDFWKGFADSLQQDPLLGQDYDRLLLRLQMRKQGRCVIGLQAENN